MNTIKVTACIITFNQELYIRQCIESVVSQIVDFEYEIIIGDDCSSDNTKKICDEYSEKYPKLIKYIQRPKNLGMIANWLATISESNGQYLAICEGDDYWIDPNKLQKQVDFLEANKDYVLTFHKIKLLNSEGELLDDFITNVPEEHETIEDLARSGNYIHTPSIVFRNIIKEMPDEFKSSPIGDYFLYMLLTQYGRVKYFNESMAVYRIGVGIWSSESKMSQDLKTMECFSLVHKVFINKNKEISDIFRNRIKYFFENKDSISFEALEKFNTNLIIKKIIYDIQITKRTNEFSNSLSIIRSKILAKEILIRILKKVRINLK